MLISAIAVEFDQIGYRAVEGKNITVCVVLMGETDSTVEVSLSSLQDTATGLTFHMSLH